MRLFAGDRGRGRAEGEQVSTRGLRDHRAVPFGAAAPISTGMYPYISNITFIRTMPECSHHNFTISHKLHKLYMYDETMER